MYLHVSVLPFRSPEHLKLQSFNHKKLDEFLILSNEHDKYTSLDFADAKFDEFKSQLLIWIWLLMQYESHIIQIG